MQKICSVCHQEKPLSDFPKHRGRCYPCYRLSERARKSTPSYLAKFRARRQQRFHDDDGTLRARKRAWDQQWHVTHGIHRWAKWAKENPEKSKESCRKFWAKLSQENPEKIKEYRRKSDRKRRLKRRANARRRYAIVRGASFADLSAAQEEEIKLAKGYRCDYCGEKSPTLTIDHITPVAHGGDDTLWNVTVACSRCNSRKGTGIPLRPVQPLLLTIAPKRKLRKKKDAA